MLKYLKTRVMIVFVMLSLFLLIGYVLLFNRAEAGQTIPQSPNKAYILTTAFHCDVDDKRYKLIYADSDLDLAIYLDLDYKPIMPKVKEGVLVDKSIKGYVKSISNKTFKIKLKDKSDNVAGLSGKCVYSVTGKYLGFISKISRDKCITCVSF